MSQKQLSKKSNENSLDVLLKEIELEYGDLVYLESRTHFIKESDNHVNVFQSKSITTLDVHNTPMKVTTTNYYRKRRRLRCCPSFPKTPEQYYQRQKLLQLYIPSVMVLLFLSTAFATVVLYLLKPTVTVIPNHSNQITTTQNTTNQMIYTRTFDSVDGTRKIGDVLNEMELATRLYCDQYSQTLSARLFFDTMCDKSNCGFDLGIASPLVKGLCSLGSFHFDIASNWWSSKTVCGWNGIGCNSDGDITSINIQNRNISISGELKYLNELKELVFIGDTDSIISIVSNTIFQIPKLERIHIERTGW
ncbi:hypothetical protein BC833DRAFT_570293, partial [Globomyces pollinis-pini]